MTASQKDGTIYVGVTNDLARRLPEHKSGEGTGFTARYGVHRLVWYEEHIDIRASSSASSRGSESLPAQLLKE
ncbi:GIY-YIG nuclease family protein [Aminobacter sp. P9b]|uniref:GIY-YIG nuclease family protein n=1 Tax=unclassified Aminobacter TaxID=2644704 RepID=UPI000D382A95|nr:GIY-YIG nuclease family protein [Aminobacter sp. MSH1]AWC24348.1 GIY-YIG nuclease superfamily protein [Aminobacter sp. MSH1]